EIATLISLSDGNKSENEYARNVLRFFAGIIFKSNFVEEKNTTAYIQSRTNHTIEDFICQVYPNPNNGQLNIKVPISANQKIKLRIMDMYGKNINSITLKKDVSVVDISELGSGIYQIIIEQDGSILLKSLISKL
ncbi:MAG: Secretion system C-terminal sorting domain, partial [Bacteroidota bacterium]